MCTKSHFTYKSIKTAHFPSCSETENCKFRQFTFIRYVATERERKTIITTDLKWAPWRWATGHAGSGRGPGLRTRTCRGHLSPCLLLLLPLTAVCVSEASSRRRSRSRRGGGAACALDLGWEVPGGERLVVMGWVAASGAGLRQGFRSPDGGGRARPRWPRMGTRPRWPGIEGVAALLVFRRGGGDSSGRGGKEV